MIASLLRKVFYTGRDMKNTKAIYLLSLLQGIYFFITGVWPLIHIPSFIWISGHKYDIWLVETVGITLAVVGIVLFSAGFNRRVNDETFLLATGCAAGLATVDVYYASIDRILDVYLLDAAVECILIILWVIFYRRYQNKKIA